MAAAKGRDAANTLACAWCILINETRDGPWGWPVASLVFYVRRPSGRNVTGGVPPREESRWVLLSCCSLPWACPWTRLPCPSCKGLGMKRVNLKVAVTLALFFGGFQALMPLIGWALGSQFLGIIGPIDTGWPLSFLPP